MNKVIQITLLTVLTGGVQSAVFAAAGPTTPLHTAAKAGNLDEVKALVGGGADINAIDENFETALYMAAKKNHVAVVEFLIGKGADVNKSNIKSVTPVCAAAREGNLDVVKVLVEKGSADLTIKSDSGKTPLAAAGNEEVRKYLRLKGAK